MNDYKLLINLFPNNFEFQNGYTLSLHQLGILNAEIGNGTLQKTFFSCL